MSDSADLERRYRRLLACYPHAFRRGHEQEILAVLMAGADEGSYGPGWVWLGPLRAPMRRLIVSAEDQSGLVAELNLSSPRSTPGAGDPSS